jgi:hypothetical protein
VITASAARRALSRKARVESIRSQVRAELARAACGKPVEAGAARARDPMEERRPRRVPLSAAGAGQLRIHEAETVRELALWQALVWGPEAAAEAVRFRPDDRPRESAWARLRAVLEALGVLWSRDHGPPGVGGVVVLCHPRTGPPASAAARWSQPWTAAHCMGAPVT